MLRLAVHFMGLPASWLLSNCSLIACMQSMTIVVIAYLTCTAWLVGELLDQASQAMGLSVPSPACMTSLFPLPQKELQPRLSWPCKRSARVVQ